MQTNGQIAREFINRFSTILRGNKSDPYSLCHRDIEVMLTGNLDMSGSISGLDAYRERVESMQPAIRFSNHNGIYVERILEDGDQVLVIARGLIGFHNNRIYNNEYAMWMQFRDGLIYRLYEDCDMSLVLTGPLGMCLCPAICTDAGAKG